MDRNNLSMVVCFMSTILIDLSGNWKWQIVLVALCFFPFQMEKMHSNNGKSAVELVVRLALDLYLFLRAKIRAVSISISYDENEQQIVLPKTYTLQQDKKSKVIQVKPIVTQTPIEEIEQQEQVCLDQVREMAEEIVELSRDSEQMTKILQYSIEDSRFDLERTHQENFQHQLIMKKQVSFDEYVEVLEYDDVPSVLEKDGLFYSDDEVVMNLKQLTSEQGKKVHFCETLDVFEFDTVEFEHALFYSNAEILEMVESLSRN